jgi:uncharacterized membrane protein
VKRRFDSEAQRRLLAAIQDIERRSSAEVVLEVHPRAASYAQADERFGGLTALLSLIAIVFLPVTFPAYAVVVDAIVFYAIGVVISRRSRSVQRLMSSAAERERAFRQKASALFHERGIANTSGETGLLVFASELERRVEILADRGVLLAVPSEEWNAALAEVHSIRRIDADHLLRVLRLLDPLLSVAVPVRAGDRDELASAPAIQFE